MLTNRIIGTSTFRLLTSVLLVGLLLVLTIGSGRSPASAADFDQDGYADLAIGAYWETVNGQVCAGAVNVLYGTAGGISAASNQLWIQDDLGPHFSWFNEYFGQVLAAGDFDGDGAADLAVGAPGKDIGGPDGGAVYVLYGASSQGLVSTGSQYFHQDSPGVGGVAEKEDFFGAALAVGDFDGDGYDDLAVGVPYEDIGTENNAGAVNILYGTAAGLTASGNQLWYEGYNGLGGGAEAGDWFGFALAAGDFDRDGHDDLAISIPGEDVGGGTANAGRVVILYGTADGLTATGSQSWQQGEGGVGDVAEEDDHFGRRLATGDFDGDGYADLAIGIPLEDVVLTVDAGMVNILFGSPDGLTSEGSQVFTLEDNAAEDEFGLALAAGDFNGDGFDDLAVGIPGEDLHSWFNIGAVEILYGGSGGLHRRSRRDDFWSQNDPGMVDGPTEGDGFGYALAAGDFDGDHYADLAVGIPKEDVGTTVNAGAVHVLYGSAGGITAMGNQFWHQDSFLIQDKAEQWDLFGSALAAIPVPRPSIPPPPPPQWEKILLPLVMNND